MENHPRSKSSMNSVLARQAFEKIDGVAACQRPTVFVMNPTHVRSSKKANTMIRPDSQSFRRRQFLQTLSGLAAGAFGAMLAPAEDLPTNTNPRAVFGDSVEPDWKQRIMITVGHENADLIGTTDRVIQAAVDYVARRGGGTVRVLPGTYRLRNSI